MEERGLDFTAYLTWIVIAIPTVMWQLRDHTLTSPRTLAWMACYAAFIIFFYLHERGNVLIVAAQSILAVVCCLLVPGGFQPVLLVIVAAQLAAMPLTLAF